MAFQYLVRSWAAVTATNPPRPAAACAMHPLYRSPGVALYTYTISEAWFHLTDLEFVVSYGVGSWTGGTHSASPSCPCFQNDSPSHAALPFQPSHVIHHTTEKLLVYSFWTGQRCGHAGNEPSALQRHGSDVPVPAIHLNSAQGGLS